MQQERKGEVHMDILLVNLPNACNSQGWVRLKPGTSNSFQVFHTVTATQILGLYHLLPPRVNISRKRDQKESHTGAKHPFMGHVYPEGPLSLKYPPNCIFKGYVLLLDAIFCVC